jgi:hypothetical protein
MSTGHPEEHPHDIRIFISHSSADSDFGIRLAEDLRRVLGDPTAVWFDSSGGLTGGDAWWRTIVDEILARPIFLVILSPDAGASKWVNDEVDLAWQQKNEVNGKRIIPLLYRPCVVRGDLRTRQVLSFVAPEEYERRFAELLRAVGMRADQSATGHLSVNVPASAPAAAPEQVHPSSGHAASDVLTARPLTDTRTSDRAELLLLSIDGLWPPSRFPLEGDSVTVGRESGNDVLLADPAVSRFHLHLSREGMAWRVEVVPGARPLYVNGVSRPSALLGHGDQVVIGGSVLRYEQKSWLTTVATLHVSDSRTLRAFGLAPQLHVELPVVTFDAPLRGDLISLGRLPDCALVIPSPLISAHHAQMRRLADGGYALEPASEVPNRFAPEGQPIPPRQMLRSGETLLVGSRAQNRFVAITYSDVFPTGPLRSQ